MLDGEALVAEREEERKKKRKRLRRKGKKRGEREVAHDHWKVEEKRSGTREWESRDERPDIVTLFTLYLYATTR